MEEEIHEVVVVGSGLTGAQACQTLVEAGMNVVLLDAGIKQPEKFKNRYPDQSFSKLRKSNDNQKNLFLGDEFEGIPWGELKTGAQITPGRKYVMEGVEKWLSVLSKTFFPMESLAFGGLGNAWGAGCYMFSEREFAEMGYKRDDFVSAYQKVADRIGVTEATLDAKTYANHGLQDLMPSVMPEKKMKLVEERYKRVQTKLNASGIFLGRPSMAITTEPKDDRKAYAYNDMEFWHDNGESVYRPWITFNQLAKAQNFKSITGKIVLTFKEEEKLVSIRVKDLNTGKAEVVKTRKLILCSGVLGTARIVLRSVEGQHKLPVLCNPYTYVPMLHLKSLGVKTEEKKSGMCQTIMFHDPNKNDFDTSIAAMYTYRSLMLFRLIKETPLNFADARTFMQYLAPAIVIAGIHHSEKNGPDKWLQLMDDPTSPTKDVLKVEYVLSEEEERKVLQHEKALFKAFKKLGCVPLKKVNPGHGASIHYAGTLPLSADVRPLHTSYSGKLNGFQNIFIGDGSSFSFLPAKGVSFTLMANAHRVASNLVKEMKNT